MRVVGIKLLKNKLSEYVKLAANGETILVTDRDKVVAELTPPREGRKQSVADERMAELIRRGIVTPAKIVGAGPPPNVPTASLAEILRWLDDARGDR